MSVEDETARPAQGLAKRRRRVLLVIVVGIALAVPGPPTLHSAFGTRVFSDNDRHNTTGPTGWSGIGFPVARGDVVILDFETLNATHEVSVRFGESLAHNRNSVYPYNATAIVGHFRFVAPSDGVIEISWRPLQVGKSVTIYHVRVVPNPTGLSLLPVFQ